jgi:FlaA1/EpsC-like NDP-sugar epimerase
LGGTKDIPTIVEKYGIENIIIAKPSMRKGQLQELYQECSKTNAKTQIMPMIEDIVSGKVSVNQFRDVQVEDLLGREPVELDIKSISDRETYRKDHPCNRSRRIDRFGNLPPGEQVQTGEASINRA